MPRHIRLLYSTHPNALTPATLGNKIDAVPEFLDNPYMDSSLFLQMKVIQVELLATRAVEIADSFIVNMVNSHE